MRWKSINFKSIFGTYVGLHFVFEFFKVASNAILNGITKGLGRPDQNRLNLHLNKSCIHSDDFSQTLFPDFWPLTEFLLWSRRQLKYRFSSRFFPRWPGARRFLSDSSDYGRAPRPLPNFAVPNLYKATLLYILSWLTLSIYCVIMSEWTNFWNTKPKKNVVQSTDKNLENLSTWINRMT